MDKLLFTEAPFPLRCSEDGRPQDEHEFDVFALDALDLDEDLELVDVNSAPGCSHARHQGNVPAPQPESQRKNEIEDRRERVRAQNRKAQARYRQKAKVNSSEYCTCTVPTTSHATPY